MSDLLELVESWRKYRRMLEIDWLKLAAAHDQHAAELEKMPV